MNNRRNGYEIWQALSRFSPDVFTHPVWVYFIENHEPISDQLVQVLQEQSQLLVTQADIRGACQVLLLCAALKKQMGKFEAALDSLQRAWELADSHKMLDIVEWAAWGSSALHILLGQPDQAINSLRWLSSQLSGKGDWVLADLVELFAAEIADRARGRRSVEIPLDWLLKWGEMSGPSNGTRSNHANLNTGFVQSIKGALFRLLSKVSRYSSLSKLKSIVSGRNGFSDDKKQGLTEHSQKSADRLSMPIQPDHHLGEPSSVASGNAAEKLPAMSEKGRVVLAVYCLGQFRAYLENKWISSWPSGKGKAILKFMVINYPQSVSKDVLMDTLWRNADPISARNNLYVAIYGLRQAFKAILPDFNLVLFEDNRYRLNPDISVWHDVEEFLRLYHNGQELELSGKLEETIQAYKAAANLYQGDFLADDLYEEWPIHTRERLRITYLDTLDRLSRIYFNQGEYLACVNLCHLILSRDNCREDAHRRLMRCYSRQGQHQLALSQFQACIEALRVEMDVDPEPVTKQLAERIRRRENI